MKIGLVLALARFYHGLSGQAGALVVVAADPGGDDRRAGGAGGQAAGPRHRASCSPPPAWLMMILAGLSLRARRPRALAGRRGGAAGRSCSCCKAYQRDAPAHLPATPRPTRPAPAITSCSPRSRWAPAGCSARASAWAPRASSTSCRRSRPTSSSPPWPRSSASSAASSSCCSMRR